MANSNSTNERPSPYLPKSLPASIRPTPPSSLASRSAAGPYSLASASKQAALCKGKGSVQTQR